MLITSKDRENLSNKSKRTSSRRFKQSQHPKSPPNLRHVDSSVGYDDITTNRTSEKMMDGTLTNSGISEAGTCILF